jgi:hypothetical protein
MNFKKQSKNRAAGDEVRAAMDAYSSLGNTSQAAMYPGPEHRPAQICTVGVVSLCALNLK